MPIVKKHRNIAYWYIPNGEANPQITDKAPQGIEYVKTESVKMNDGRYKTIITCGNKKIEQWVESADGITTCESDYKYTFNIQQTVYKLLNAKFPKKEYDREFKRIIGQRRKEGLCR